MKRHCQTRKCLTVIWQWKTLKLLITKQVKKFWQDFGIGDYQDLQVQSYSLLLTDVFKNFPKKFIEKYELDPAYLLSTPRLA